MGLHLRAIKRLNVPRNASVVKLLTSSICVAFVVKHTNIAIYAVMRIVPVPLTHSNRACVIHPTVRERPRWSNAAGEQRPHDGLGETRFGFETGHILE